jgi:hypothetical protein
MLNLPQIHHTSLQMTGDFKMKKKSLQASHIWVQSARKSNYALFKFWVKRPRSALVRTFEKALIGHSLSSILVRDIASLSRFPFAQSDLQYAELIEDAVLVSRPQTKLMGGVVELKDSRRAIFRYKFSNSRVHTTSGHMLVCGGFLCEELFGQYIAFFSAGTIADEYHSLKKAKRVIEGTWATIGVPHYYFHYITQHLPALLRSLEDRDIQGVILHKSAPSWVVQSILSAGYGVRFVDEKSVVVENLVATSVGEIVTGSEIAVLRNAYAHLTQNLVPHKLLFIGRLGLNRNLGSLENELEDFVRSRQGEVVNPAELGWEKELETFGSCNKLILVYGSATANAVWMKPGSKVLLLTDFSRYTTQVEKAFFDACKVVWKEIDTSSYSRLDGKLLEEISNFINH